MGLQFFYARLLPGWLCFMIFNPVLVFSHALDISYTTLTPQSKAIYGSTYIHPYELNLIGSALDVNIHLEENFSLLPEIIIPYFKAHFVVVAGEKVLELENITLEEKTLAQILEDGIYLKFVIPRVSGTPVYRFQISLFIEFYSTQTNKVLILDPQGKVVPKRPEILFTRHRQKLDLNFNQLDLSGEIDNHIDSDKDGLTNHLEKLYGTDSTLTDTDNDNYTDFEEFIMGWDPLDPKRCHGQHFVYLEQMGALTATSKNVLLFGDSARYYVSNEPLPLELSSDFPEVVQKKTTQDLLNPPPHLSGRWRLLVHLIQTNRFTRLFLNGFFSFALLALLALFQTAKSINAPHPFWTLSRQKNIKILRKLGLTLVFLVLQILDLVIVSQILQLSFHWVKWPFWQVTLGVIGWMGVIALFGFYLIQIIRLRKTGIKTIWRDFAETIFRSKAGKIFNFIYRGFSPHAFKWLIFFWLLAVGRIQLMLPALLIWVSLVLLFFLVAGGINNSSRFNLPRIAKLLELVGFILSALLILLVLLSLLISCFS